MRPKLWNRILAIVENLLGELGLVGRVLLIAFIVSLAALYLIRPEGAAFAVVALCLIFCAFFLYARKFKIE